MIFHCVDLEKHFKKNVCLTFTDIAYPKSCSKKKYTKRRNKKSVIKGADKHPVRDEIVINKRNRQAKIKKIKKAKKSLFCKVSYDSESEVELVLENDTCTEESDDEVIESDFVVVKVKGKSREVRYIAQWILLTEMCLKVLFSKKYLKL